jgi:drug/metabolite transporter (DMT)-like permease
MARSVATPRRIQILAAFFAIYVLWGSTYLAIRVAVHSVPPLFAAGLRFLIAGGALYAWTRLRGSRPPSRLEWRNLCILGALMFLIAYSALFWAEKSLPSGIASVLVATVPVWTAVLEIFVFRRQQRRWTFLAAIVLGLLGVAILSLDSTGGNANVLACLAVVSSSVAWAFGTILTTTLALPPSKTMSAGAEMMTGGAMLLLGSAILGEIPPWPHVSAAAAGAIAYLIVAGSLIAFTAYQWLLTQMPTTTVTSYAYVNPVIAIIIGYWLGAERIGPRTLMGALLVLASTIAVVRAPTNKGTVQN